MLDRKIRPFPSPRSTTVFKAATAISFSGECTASPFFVREMLSIRDFQSTMSQVRLYWPPFPRTRVDCEIEFRNVQRPFGLDNLSQLLFRCFGEESRAVIVFATMGHPAREICGCFPIKVRRCLGLDKFESRRVVRWNSKPTWFAVG